MKVSSQLLVSPAKAIRLIVVVVVVVAIAIVPLAANITVSSAQQQPPSLSSATVTQNRTTTLFQSTEDGVSLMVPEGWIIHDVNNTGSSALSEESTQGYGILAQLCPEEEEEQQAATLSNVSSSRGSTAAASCQGSEGDIIHIVRYPDLDTRLQVGNNVTTNNNSNTNITIDNILSYHMQKLQEVGYSGIEIVNSTDTTLDVTNAQTNQTISIAPAKNVEMKYRTAASAPNETRTGYFILTATNATHPNVGITKGYSIFYEGNSTSTAETTTTRPISLAPIPLPAPARQVFDSFELIAEVPTEPLTVEIISSDTEGVAPATFEFEANVTGGTGPYTYSWDFGDGSSEESDEETVVHTFDVAGTYNIGLTVTDSSGQTASDILLIDVEEAPAADEVVVDEIEEEVEDNNLDPFNVDDFIDELFDRLGIRSLRPALN